MLHANNREYSVNNSVFSMAKSKRFSTAQDFELQLNLIIEGLIDYHSRLPELEKKDIQVAEIAEKLSVAAASNTSLETERTGSKE